jgi:hypothetical protein
MLGLDQANDKTANTSLSMMIGAPIQASIFDQDSRRHSWLRSGVETMDMVFSARRATWAYCQIKNQVGSLLTISRP